jgi:hypothetical protein
MTRNTTKVNNGLVLITGYGLVLPNIVVEHLLPCVKVANSTGKGYSKKVSGNDNGQKQGHTRFHTKAKPIKFQYVCPEKYYASESVRIFKGPHPRVFTVLG